MQLQLRRIFSSVTSKWLLLMLVLLVLPLYGLACVTPPRGDDDDSASGDDDDSTDEPVDFRFWSPDFEDGGMFSAEFECYQGNPQIQWEGVPEGTVSLALIFDDPTAGNFPHWAIYNIAPTELVLSTGISGDAISNDVPEGSSELENGFGYEGYLGSCPCGSSPNTYRWRLWALDAELEAPGAGSASSQFYGLAEAAEDASIEMLEMSHRYGPATICP